MATFECKLFNRPVVSNIYNGNAKKYEDCSNVNGKNKNICNQCVLWVLNENQPQK